MTVVWVMSVPLCSSTGTWPSGFIVRNQSAALAELPEVAEAVIVGVPDSRWGEVGRAYVIPVAGREITSEDVIAHCMKRLAKFKVPKSAFITDAIPRTTSGKVQKHPLRTSALQELGLQ